MDAEERLSEDHEMVIPVGGQDGREARPSLMSLLVQAGIASEEELRQVATDATFSGQRFGEAIVDRGWLDEGGLARLLAEQWRLPFLEDSTVVEIDPAAASLLPFEQLQELKACVVGIEAGVPLVVVAEPTTERLNDLRGAAGGDVRFAVVTAWKLGRLLEEVATHQGQPVRVAIDVATKEADTSWLKWPDDVLNLLHHGITGLQDQIEEHNRGRAIAEQELEVARQELAAVREQQAADQDRLARQSEELSTIKRTLGGLLTHLEDQP